MLIQGRRPPLRARKIALCAGLAPFVLATAAFAQNAATDHARDAADVSDVQEIVVTARHRSENAQDVPAALSVIGGDFLEKTNTIGIAQVVQLVPSLQFQATNARNSNVNIRGLGTNVGLANDGLTSGVGFYIDGVFYARSGPTVFELLDVQRVEVLRGPQGTLFGKDTTAGAIAITTASPTFTPTGTFEVSGGNLGYFQAKGAISGPIIADKLAGRLSIGYTTRDGSITNLFDGDKVNDYRNRSIRGQLLYTPNEALSVRFIADYSVQPLHCCAQLLSGVISPPNGKNFVNYAKTFGWTPVVDPFSRNANINSPFSTRQETGGASVEARYNLPNAVFTSITAWRFWNWWPENDSDFSPVSVSLAGGVRDYQRQFTQEFRVASAGENRIDYVAGVFLYREQLKAVGHSVFGPAASYYQLGPTVPAIVAENLTNDSVGKYNTTSVAAYGQAVLHVTDRLNLTGGLRYTYDQKRGNFTQVSYGAAPLTGANASYQALRNSLGQNLALSLADNDSRVSWMLNGSYKVTPDILAYVNYARGYKSGGLNLQQLPAAAKVIVAPEQLDAIELGLKTSLFDRRVTLNAALFWQRDKDYQGNVFDQNVNRLYISNVPEVRSRGLELELQARPSEDLTFYAGLTYNEAEYTRHRKAACGIEAINRPSCDLSGQVLTGVPRWTVSTGGEYSRPVSLGAKEARVYVAADLSYRSSVYSHPTNSITSLLPELTLINARAGVRTDRWDAYVWSRNLADKDYLTFVSPGSGNTGALNSQLGDPRTWGATVRYKY